MKRLAEGKGMGVGSLVLLAMACLGWTAAIPCQAGLIRVPEDYPTFRQGLAAAGSGDTLLVGPGYYYEPGEPAPVNPGVTVIGAGWAFPISGTILFGIPLYFLAGSEPAIVQDLWMHGGRVISDNALATVRGCFFGTFHGEFLGPVLYSRRGGLTVEHSFIRCRDTSQFSRYIDIRGGAFLMRNCVVAVPSAWELIAIQSFDIPITSVDIIDNTFYSDFDMLVFVNSYPMPVGPVRFINNIFYADTNYSFFLRIECGNGATATLRYNAFHPSPQTSCGPLDGTNIIADPLFCDVQSYLSKLEGFELDWASPCIGAGQGGTTIGALGVGCGIPAGIPGAGVSVAGLRVEVVPNPVAGGGTMFLTAKEPLPVLLELYDSAGRLETRATVSARPGVNAYSLGEEIGMSLRRGVHFLVASQGQERAVEKVVVVP